MEICIFISKLFVVFTIEILIIKSVRNADTSELHRIIFRNPGQMLRIVSNEKINELERDLKKLSIPYNILSMMCISGIGVISFLLVFRLSSMFFSIKSVVYIISIPFLYTGFGIIKFFAEREQTRLESGLSDFFIQLKGALKVNSDMIEALRRVQNNVLMPFSEYTKQMLNEINMGKLPEKALEEFAQKINIKKFSFYISNVRYCHIYGGNIELLTSKTQEIISEALKQKKKRDKETKSACLVLYILVIIDFYMYFSFINSNDYYLNIMTNNLAGQVIINVNFICVWVMMYLSRVIKKLDY